MELGDLEFKPEDFNRIAFSEDYALQACKVANHLLKERLEKAPILYCAAKGLGTEWWSAEESDDHQKGRLVCIEEIR